MKRFRATVVAICLILGWLGYSDLSIFFRNRTPLEISITELENTGAPREWLTVTGGYQDLLQAINMSGTMEIDSFLVPLKHSPEAAQIKVWFETRDPEIVEALKTYYFMLEEAEQRQAFLEENQHLFNGARQLTGMTADNLVADSNQQKLVKLLQEMKVQVAADTIFISEGKQPVLWRGAFFALMALVGLVKLLLDLKKPRANQIGRKHLRFRP